MSNRAELNVDYISVDLFFFPNVNVEKNTHHRRLKQMLDELDEKVPLFLEATAKGVREEKHRREFLCYFKLQSEKNHVLFCPK